MRKYQVGNKFKQIDILGTFTIMQIYEDSCQLLFQHPYGDNFVKYETFEEIKNKFIISEYYGFREY